MAGVAPLPPSFRSAVSRPPHQEAIRKKLLKEPDDVAGDPLGRLGRVAFFFIRVEEVIACHVAHRDVKASGLPFRDSDIADLGMSG